MQYTLKHPKVDEPQKQPLEKAAEIECNKGCRSFEFAVCDLLLLPAFPSVLRFLQICFQCWNVPQWMQQHLQMWEINLLL